MVHPTKDDAPASRRKGVGPKKTQTSSIRLEKTRQLITQFSISIDFFFLSFLKTSMAIIP